MPNRSYGTPQVVNKIYTTTLNSKNAANWSCLLDLTLSSTCAWSLDQPAPFSSSSHSHAPPYSPCWVITLSFIRFIHHTSLWRYYIEKLWFRHFASSYLFLVFWNLQSQHTCVVKYFLVLYYSTSISHHVQTLPTINPSCLVELCHAAGIGRGYLMRLAMCITSHAQDSTGRGRFMHRYKTPRVHYR